MAPRPWSSDRSRRARVANECQTRRLLRCRRRRRRHRCRAGGRRTDGRRSATTESTRGRARDRIRLSGRDVQEKVSCCIYHYRDERLKLVHL